MKPTLGEVLNATLNVLNITKENYRVIRKSRLAKAVKVRQLVSYIGTRYGYSQHQIGELLAIKPCTVSYHNQLIEGYLSYDKELSLEIDKVLSTFEEVFFYHRLNGWIARDKEDENLSFFSDKPENIDGTWHREGGLTYNLPKSYFPQVRYEDSPRNCEITFRLK